MTGSKQDPMSIQIGVFLEGLSVASLLAYRF